MAEGVSELAQPLGPAHSADPGLLRVILQIWWLGILLMALGELGNFTRCV